MNPFHILYKGRRRLGTNISKAMATKDLEWTTCLQHIVYLVCILYHVRGGIDGDRENDAATTEYDRMSNVFRFFRALCTDSAHGHLNIALLRVVFLFQQQSGTRSSIQKFTEKQHFDAKKKALHCALETETSKQRGSCKSVGASETSHVQGTQNQRR
jgi:hypothetical protein